ncbi:MAG: hypothetical protein OIN88_12240 [Candidatus Methanoperedens sp.]|nr:hypothetical protein [Candidatus Methanoperedens sp.]MCZ7360045.1 hypothetical protein [Candidatus Methanoperedens sp.]HLB70525.1 hypothetical protein [Candidatus Methanoperedens sp.]
MNDEQKSSEEKPLIEEKSLTRLINIGVVIMLVALIFIAMFTFYFSMLSAISVLFDYRYVELIRAIFSLVIIGIGIYLVKMFLSGRPLR